MLFAAVSLFVFVPTVFAAVDLSDSKLAAHAKLPQNNNPGPTLADTLETAQMSDVLVTTVLDEPDAGSPSGGLSIAQILQRRACMADLIVSGQVGRHVYHLSASGSAIYGDYEFLADSVVRF